MTDWGLRTRAIRFAISNPMERGNYVWKMTRYLCPTTAIGYHERNSVCITLRTLPIDRRLMCMWRIISGKRRSCTLVLMAKVLSSTWIILNLLILPQKLNEMRKLLFCLFFLCFPWLWLRAQQRIAFARLPPFERAVVCVKFFEGFHGKGCYPYVGYGHQLQKGEHFSSNMPEWQADSLLRADLMAQFDRFKCYGKDALLLSLLAYNVGAGRILGYGKQPKSQLLRKIESGDRNYIQEYLSFCHYNGKILRGLVKRRQVEHVLSYYLNNQYQTTLSTFFIFNNLIPSFFSFRE